jgi:DNA-binding SARP family transcriptional activator
VLEEVWGHGHPALSDRPHPHRGTSSTVDESVLAGRQGRLAFAMLACQRAHPMSRDALADQLWPGQLPAKWERALRAIVSKLRSGLATAGLAGEVIHHAFACYQLQLPADAWVDVEAAEVALHEAETAVAAGDITAAYGPAHVALYITERPFLPGETAEWAAARQAQWRAMRVRALDVAAVTCAANKELDVALRHAEQAVATDPLRETGWRRLMALHADNGDRANALRVYERCRQALADELGVYPSPETQARYTELLG